ncbi:hypothetical protein BGM26_20605 [Bacillus sp. FJAT-29790]|uniref:hypothetical protein n=1 Tax=Bacillus sp. FJAT-29790 TaxID=1895002 RepID=UPI001C241E11|nr:hypothetical protein [Bacillus sp. FJAT-29790]MBU8881323.1 hypothetical protein [Bacillus sp. FJAT-29790]
MQKEKMHCGSKWAFIVDIGLDPVTGNRMQKVSEVLKQSRKLKQLLPIFIHELNRGTYLEKADHSFSDFAKE